MNSITNWQSVITKTLNDNGIFQLEIYKKQLKEYCNKWNDYISSFEGISSSFDHASVQILITKVRENKSTIEVIIKPFYKIENNKIILVISSHIYDWGKKSKDYDSIVEESYNKLDEIFNEDFVLNKFSEIFTIQYPKINI